MKRFRFSCNQKDFVHLCHFIFSFLVALPTNWATIQQHKEETSNKYGVRGIFVPGQGTIKEMSHGFSTSIVVTTSRLRTSTEGVRCPVKAECLPTQHYIIMQSSPAQGSLLPAMSPSPRSITKAQMTAARHTHHREGPIRTRNFIYSSTTKNSKQNAPTSLKRHISAI